jgi:hypothetical protein
LSDIFREIEEDIRADELKKLWDKYGLYLLGAALAVVLIVAATVGWRSYRQSQNEAMSSRYEAIATSAEVQPAAEAAAAFEAFAKDSSGGYTVLAQMRQAASLHEAGNDTAAVQVYDAIAASKAPLVLRQLATLKGGFLLIDSAPYDDIKARLMPLTAAGAPWRNMAREAIGTSAYKAGAYADAQAQFAAILRDGESSEGLRTRAAIMQTLLAPLLPNKVSTDTGNQQAPAPKASSAQAE